MLTDVKLHHFRCFSFFHQPLSKKNIFFHGANGLGKTSILEGLYQLFSGRSFRTSHTKELVQVDYSQFTVTGKFSEGFQIGIQKSRNGASKKLKINGAYVASLSELVSLFPSRVITPISYKEMITPSSRRNWLDWLVFHVEHSSHFHFANSQKILKQRNALLKIRNKTGKYDEQFEAWDAFLVEHWIFIDRTRRKYLTELTELVNELLCVFDLPKISFTYKCGWSEEGSETSSELHKQLMSIFYRDLKSGFTNLGINKADLKIKVYNTDAHDILSRGQQKVLLHVVNSALIRLFQKYNNKKPYLIFDDAFEEIDHSNQNKLFRMISDIDYEQCFFSSVTPYDNIQKLFDIEMFHVEHSK